MVITIDNWVKELRHSVPPFAVDPDAEGLGYLIANDFARFICSEAEVLQYAASEVERFSLSTVPECMNFLERALADEDSMVRNLVRECVESLVECPWQEQILTFAGPRVIALWPVSE
jgi:hypothetical protein